MSDPSAPTNVRIKSNFIHDLAYFSRDSNHANGPSHNDGIQIQGGDNVVIEGNRILIFLSRKKGTLDCPARTYGQGILVQPNLAPIRSSRIAENWIYGGKVGIYVLRGGIDTMQFGECAANRLNRPGRFRHEMGSRGSFRRHLR